MDFFDKLGETISTKSKDVAKKAKEIAEVVSLNAKISTQEDIINKAYQDIGKKFYEQNKNDSFHEFGAEFDIISHACEEIEKFKNEIQLIKNTKICPKCQEEVAAEASFCSKCGSQFEVEDEEAKEVYQEAEPTAEAEPTTQEQATESDDVII